MALIFQLGQEIFCLVRKPKVMRLGLCVSKAGVPGHVVRQRTGPGDTAALNGGLLALERRLPACEVRVVVVLIFVLLVVGEREIHSRLFPNQMVPLVFLRQLRRGLGLRLQGEACEAWGHEVAGHLVLEKLMISPERSLYGKKLLH